MKSTYDMLLMNLWLGHNNYMGPTFLTSVLLFSKQPLTMVMPHHTFYHKNKQPLKHVLNVCLRWVWVCLVGSTNKRAKKHVFITFSEVWVVVKRVVPPKKKNLNLPHLTTPYFVINSTIFFYIFVYQWYSLRSRYILILSLCIVNLDSWAFSSTSSLSMRSLGMQICLPKTTNPGKLT